MGHDRDEQLHPVSRRGSSSDKSARYISALKTAPKAANSTRSNDLIGSSSRRTNDQASSPRHEHDSSTTAQTRSRASTTTRARVPRALQGIGREELEIYQRRWDLMSDSELLRACGSSSKVGQSPSPSRTHSDSTLLSATLDARALTPEDVPRLSRSSSSLSSPSTPRIRPRPAKRYSTQILALTLPTGRAEPTASSSRTSQGLFPPSPPSDSETGFGRGAGEENLDNDTHVSGISWQELDSLGSANRHPLRVLSRIARELGESCLMLEEENEILRAKLEREETLDGSEVFTPRKGSTSLDQAPAIKRPQEMLPTTGLPEDLVNQFLEEDQVSKRILSDARDCRFVLKVECSVFASFP